MTTVSAHHAEAPLILSIDVGTSSTRALLFDARGRAVDGITAQERYSVRSTEDGASEDDPDAALERVWRCVDAALKQAGQLAEAIGLSETQMSLFRSGKVKGIRFSTLAAMCDVLDCVPGDLIGFERD